ncbi:hypothetical protein [Streptomyces sp. NPDC005322]|uniref:hypothetical protein n=1 Tax=unclassified Streptomyces TaxID=2593676 RepID=UPI0033A0AF63
MARHHRNVAEASPVRLEQLVEPGAHGGEQVIGRANRGWGCLVPTARSHDARTEAVRPAAFHPHPEDQDTSSL